MKSGLYICKENVKTQKPSPRFFSPVPRNRYRSPRHRILRSKWVLLWPLPSLSVSGRVQLYQTKCVLHCVWPLPRGCESGHLVRARDASRRSGYLLLLPPWKSAAAVSTTILRLVQCLYLQGTLEALSYGSVIGWDNGCCVSNVRYIYLLFLKIKANGSPCSHLSRSLSWMPWPSLCHRCHEAWGPPCLMCRLSPGTLIPVYEISYPW